MTSVSPTVVVCRPRAQAQALVQQLRAEGLDATPLTLLDVEAMTPGAEIIEQLNAAPLHSSIWVSQSAVAHGAQWISDKRAAAIAVGQGTKRALQRANFETVVAASDEGNSEDSEGLLSLALLQRVAGQRVALVRGVSAADQPDGSRMLIADSLRHRGASVLELVCYRRNTRELDEVDRLYWQERMRESSQSLVWLIGSRETLDSWRRALSGAEPRGPQSSLLAEQNIVVPHPRIAEYAQTLGLRRVRVSAIDVGSLVALLQAR